MSRIKSVAPDFSFICCFLTVHWARCPEDFLPDIFLCPTKIRHCPITQKIPVSQWHKCWPRRLLGWEKQHPAQLLCFLLTCSPQQEEVKGMGLLLLSLPCPAPAVRPQVVTQGITGSQDAYRLQRYHRSSDSREVEVVTVIIPVAL